MADEYLKNIEEIKLTELVETEVLQELQDSFSKIAGIAAIIADENGTAITKGSHYSEFCRKYNQKFKKGRAKCEKCNRDSAAMALEKGGLVSYCCHANLMNFAAPIMLENRMIGIVTGGQIMTEAPDLKKMAQLADEIGIDKYTYIEAAKRVNIVPKEETERVAEFMYSVSNIISHMAYKEYVSSRLRVEANKNANMKSDFLANMSHEIRTPMNAVMGMAKLALREAVSPAVREYLSQIISSGKLLLALINDILDFSKIESGKMDIDVEPYDPMSLVNEISNIIVARIGDKNIELILNIDPELPVKLLGDSIRLKQIIVNLTNNAVKFTQNGKVELRLGFVKRSADEIMLLGDVKDTGIGIKRENFDKLFRSFEQLDSKRNRNIEGTGLGLVISKRFLELMDGEIRVESEYGKGSIFSFMVPQKIVEDRPSVTIREKKGIVVGGLISNPYVKEQLKWDIERLGGVFIEIGLMDDPELLLTREVEFLFVEQVVFSERMQGFSKEHPEITTVLIISQNASVNYSIPNLEIVKKPVYSYNVAAILNHEDLYAGFAEQETESFQFIAPEAEILVVDDNEVNLTVAEGLLEPLQMKIDTAYSGKEAIEKISSKKYDIVFMDHMMPEIDGVETTRIIREFHPEYKDVPIIALTANVMNETRNMFLNEGMNDFVAKPIELRVIVSKIRNWLPESKIKNVEGVPAEYQNGKGKKSDIDIEIEGLDIKYAVNLLGSEKLFWAVLKDYYRTLKKKIGLIKSYEEAENWKDYTIEVHALKSSSRQIGAIELSQKAENLEAAGNREDGQTIHMLTNELVSQCLRYVEILGPYMKEESVDEGDKKMVSSKQLKEIFAKQKEALDNLDMGAMETLTREMATYSFAPGQQELYEILENAVESMDVEACEEIIREWEELL